MRKIFQSKTKILAALLLLLSCTAAFAAQKARPKPAPGTLPVVLVADEVSFDESAHAVSAQGHAVVTYLDLVLHADSITMDSQENIIRAFANEGKKIRVEREAWNAVLKKNERQELTGTFLEYHLNDSTGFLETAEGTTTVENGTLFVTGGKAEVAPPQIAHEQRWVHGRAVKKSQPQDTIVRWNGAGYTTCPQDEPHYRFVSKKAVLIPNKHIRLQKPRVYAGKRFLFTVPFDIFINQGPRKKNRISVMPNYDDDKRYGIQAMYRHRWENGQLRLGAAMWTEGITEYDVRLDQKLTDWLALYAGTNYHYEDTLRETKSRPFWGLTAEHSGWSAELGWAEREKRKIIRRPGEKEYETTIWRKPEFEIYAPWIGLHIGDFSQYARFKGNWGRFQETGVNRRLYHGGFVERYGWGLDYYTEYPFRVGKWIFSPFFKVDYWNYGYKNDRSDRLEITKGIFGIRYSCGIFEFGTAYEQRRVSGQSAFGYGWDYLSDENTLYQRVGVKLGPSLRFALQGIWEMSKNRPHDMKTLAYVLTYNNSCCTRWELIIHEDKRRENNNNWITLSFAINAFPDSNFKWGHHSLENPFGRPGKLQPKMKTPYTPTAMESDGTLQAESAEIRVPVFDL